MVRNEIQFDLSKEEIEYIETAITVLRDIQDRFYVEELGKGILEQIGRVKKKL